MHINSKEYINSFWQYDEEFWYKKLNSSKEGLSIEQANEINNHKKNQRKEKPLFIKKCLLFLEQFRSPLMLLLIGAVVISAFLGEITTLIIILTIVISTALVSFIQENNAEKIVEKLKTLVANNTIVIRDGKKIEIDHKQVVNGDIIIVHAGDIIPADCLIISATELQANEIAMTGEAYPVKKDVGIIPKDTTLSKRFNCLWEGTSIVSGNAKALVIHTGNETIYGGLSQSVGKHFETSFEKGIKHFGYLLMKITLVLAVTILLINLFGQKSTIINSCLFALALAIGMAPELLPAITTIAMSAGAKRLLKKKVIVKKLTAVQNLGEINLLCTDKTGTITEGSIEIHSIMNGFDKKDNFVNQISYWNALFQEGYANPIDDSLKKIDNVVKNINLQKFDEVPYDFIRKRISIAIKLSNNDYELLDWKTPTNENIDKLFITTKGEFSSILSICKSIRLENNNIEDIQNYNQHILDKYNEYGSSGLRVIAICYKQIDIVEHINFHDEQDMIFAGFILLEDPIKDDIIETIKQLDKLKVGLKIITGDNKVVAKSIAIQIGISNPNVITGNELFNADEVHLNSILTNTHIFAEVEPNQKEKIIHALKKNYTVAYIGDGINDVSALNAADIGISVNNAVDVAKEAADFVLLEKSLMVLVDGIKEGRKTFANTLKYILINTGSTFGSMLSISIISIILPFLPMLPIQILLINFLTDFPFLMVSSDNVDESQLASPGTWNFKLIRNYMLIFGLHNIFFQVILFYFLRHHFETDEVEFRTAWFLESIIVQLGILFIVRTRKSIFKSKPSNPLILLSLISFLIVIYLPYCPLSEYFGFIPLSSNIMIVIYGIVLAYLVTAEFLKIWFFKKFK